MSIAKGAGTGADESVRDAQDADFSLLQLSHYKLWDRLYPFEEYGDKWEFLKKLQNTDLDGPELKKLMLRLLCALDDSSSFAEAFCSNAELLSDIAAKIPFSLPADVLPLFSELACSSSYGCGIEEEDEADMTWEEIEAELPVWLPALLEACIRCCNDPVDPSSAFLGVNHVLDREFSWVVWRFPGLDAVFTSAGRVVGDESAAPLAKAHAVMLLSARLATASLSEDDALGVFIPIQELLVAQLAADGSAASSTSPTRLYTLACLEHVATGACAVGRKPGPGRAHLLASGLVQMMIEYVRKICWDEDIATYKAICAVGMCVVSIVVPTDVSIDSCADTVAMRRELDILIAGQRDVCTLLAALHADEVLAACLVGDDSGSHLRSQNSEFVAGLLALLAFADPLVSVECSQRLAQTTAFVECVRDYHALSRTYKRSRTFSASIMGLGKVAAVSKLLLICFLPSFYPSQEQLGELSQRKKRVKCADGHVSSAAPARLPTPLEVVTEALESRDSRSRSYVVDDWMLALSCLESRHSVV